MKARHSARMTAKEHAAFLAEQLLLTCATISHDGWPHVAPLNYTLRGGEVWCWTYAKSQKALNLDRDNRATVQVEAGTDYDELRGVMVKCRVTLHREVDLVERIGIEVVSRAAGIRPEDLADATRQQLVQQAPKRVALQFHERSRASWDHRKLR